MPANYVVDITIDDVIDALKAFLVPFFVGGDPANIVRGQGNRVAMPPSPCIVLTEILSVPIETPNFQLDALQLDVTGPKRIDIQIDFYGAQAGDFCAAIENVFRTPYACDQFADGIKPLYSSDGIQAPLVTGEEQYESHWLLTASLQYNPTLTIPKQSATALAVNVFEDIP